MEEEVLTVLFSTNAALVITTMKIMINSTYLVKYQELDI